MQVVHERVKVPVGSLSMPAYLARPTAPGTYPAVLVFQEIFGVNHHIRSVADQYAQDGYIALAPDIFWRTQPRVVDLVQHSGKLTPIGCGNRVARLGPVEKQSGDVAVSVQAEHGEANAGRARLCREKKDRAARYAAARPICSAAPRPVEAGGRGRMSAQTQLCLDPSAKTGARAVPERNPAALDG